MDKKYFFSPQDAMYYKATGIARMEAVAEPPDAIFASEYTDSIRYVVSIVRVTKTAEKFEENQVSKLLTFNEVYQNLPKEVNGLDSEDELLELKLNEILSFKLTMFDFKTYTTIVRVL